METPVFLEDIYPENLLYAITIRSPIAKGRLLHIQIPKLPENYTIITSKDIPGENRLKGTSMPILADKNLSYIGEPVALLFGENKKKLEELSEQCAVITDEGKPVFSSNDIVINDFTTETTSIRTIQTGNTEEALKKEGRIITGNYITGIQDHWYAEPAGAITMYEKKQIIVKTATQWPYHVKYAVANVLRIDHSLISVESATLCLHMDGKLWYPSLISCHAALGTFFTKRPIRLILNREEDFMFSPKRCNAIIDIISVIDENGKINAAEIDISVNLGAYGVNGGEILEQVCLGVAGCYKIDNLKLMAKSFTTNIPPQGPFSGFGLSQGFFAMERHVSQIADTTNQDPAQWRNNHAGYLLTPLSGSAKKSIPYSELINTAAKISDYYRKWASYELLRQSRKGKIPEKGENIRGIGIALGFQGNGLLYSGEDKGNYSAEVTLTKESILEIRTSINSPEDYNKIWGKIASQIMSIEPDMVRIVTTQVPDCGPSCASRNITAITKLIEKCCVAIRKQRFHSPLPITVRRSIKPQNGTLLNGLVSAPAGKTMDISGFLKPGMAAAVVEVSIDLVECIPKIRGVWLAIAGGKIISKNRAVRALTRSAIQALGWAYTENIEYIEGVLPWHQYENFSIPSPVEIPPIIIEFISANSDEPRGIGELPFTCIPAAFLQAVSQAMDHCYKTIPLKRKDIWEMLQLKNYKLPIQRQQ